MDPGSFDLADDDLLPLIRQVRSDVPAVTHVDYSARVQTVGPESNPELRAVLEEFRNITGCALVVNTSLNVRGEPIACTPHDALSCFLRTDIDVLVVEDVVITGKSPTARAPADASPDGKVRAADPPAADSGRTDLFFRLFLLPLAERSGAAFAHRLGCEERTGSAYSLPEAMPDFWELETLDAVGELLERTWKAHGLASSCSLVRPLLELVEELVNECDDEDLGVVTPYTYTLF
jgi:carbamoyltransferase